MRAITPDDVVARGDCPALTGMGTAHTLNVTADETWTAAASPHVVSSLRVRQLAPGLVLGVEAPRNPRGTTMTRYLLYPLLLLALTLGGPSCKSKDAEPPEDDSSAEESTSGEEDTHHAGVSDSVRKCRNGCNSRCHGAKNKSKCVNECRRACG